MVSPENNKWMKANNNTSLKSNQWVGYVMVPLKYPAIFYQSYQSFEEKAVLTMPLQFAAAAHQVYEHRKSITHGQRRPSDNRYVQIFYCLIKVFVLLTLSVRT